MCVCVCVCVCVRVKENERGKMKKIFEVFCECIEPTNCDASKKGESKQTKRREQEGYIEEVKIPLVFKVTLGF